VAQGDWLAIAAGIDWTPHDLSDTDTLSVYLYSVEGILKENLPKVFLEDVNNEKTTKFSIGDFSDDLLQGEWIRVKIPMQIFFDAGDSVDFSVIKTVGWAQNLPDDVEHTLFIDDVRVYKGGGSSGPVASPQGLSSKGYDSHVFLWWKPNTEPYLEAYEVFRSANGGTFQKIAIVGWNDTVYSDHVSHLGTNLSLKYTIRALNDYNEPSDYSDTIGVATYDMTDTALLTMVQEATFRYFWDFAHPVSGMARERNTSGHIVTSGGSGFGIMAIMVGIERSFINREEGITRMLKILDFLENADRFHGAWPHWMDGNTGEVIPFSVKDDGGDLVETSFLLQGLLTARQYFNGLSPEEIQIRAKITQLWEDVDWNWYRLNSGQVLYWHWSPNYGWAMNMHIRGYNETMIAYILAVASPTHGVPASLWHNGWAGLSSYVNGKTFYGYKLWVGWDYGGPLFFAHYSYLGFDPRNIKDDYANYFNNNKNQTLINWAYCIDNPHNYPGYSENCWGLTASDDPFGYAVHEPIQARDNGTITPSAALSSMPYTPEYSMDALKHFYRDRGDKIWGPYGFYDAFNIKHNWFANSYIAIDQGPIICMIENYRTGLLWDLFMSNPEITTALSEIGFVDDPYSIKEMTDTKKNVKISFFPNPLKNLLNITVDPVSIKITEINIYAIDGQQIFTSDSFISKGNGTVQLTFGRSEIESGSKAISQK
jgi:hypothetical protein